MLKQIVKILLLLIWVTSAFAQNLDELFKQNFYKGYSSGMCGQNILNLIKEAKKLNLNLENTKLIEIHNVGGSVFGMVNAEFAREKGAINQEFPKVAAAYFPGETNWYHHVILLDNNKIYDFDFGNEPVILNVNDYFDKMFLIEKTSAQGGKFFVGREEKRKYQLKVTSVPDIILSLENPRNNQFKPIPAVYRLGEFMDWYALF